MEVDISIFLVSDSLHVPHNLLSDFMGHIRGSEWGGGPFVGCRLKFSYFVDSRLKFSIFVGSRLDFLIFVGCPKISVNK